MSDSGPVGSAGSESGTTAASVPGQAAPRWTRERVLSVRHWTGNLLSFSISRPPGFHFTPGHYARLGLGSDPDGTEWRPFSIVSAPDEDLLEFFAVLVPAGTFSDRLAQVHPGDPMRIEKASFGFLTVEQMAPGKDLWLLASGTGLGPFVAILRDTTVWQSFDRIILVHSVRYPAELAYRQEIEQRASELATTGIHASLRYIPVITRAPQAGVLSARIPLLIEDGQLEHAAGAALNSEHSRVMACGNPELVKTLRAMLTAKGFQVSRRGALGQMAFEKYW
jgi:ferredoxin/flavodoxin---NADP+ reductase